MTIRNLPNGEIDSGTDDGRIPSEEVAAGPALEVLTMAAILERVDAALNEPPPDQAASGSHELTVKEVEHTRRYEVREDIDGWQVADLLTGFVAEVDGLVLARLTARRANSLASVLNRIVRDRFSCSSD